MISAEIIAIGSELLLGGRTDTNSVFLSEMLANLGIEVGFKTVVGDNVSHICQALVVASRRVDIVVVSGGLGPTIDDLTRDSVARVTGRPLRRRDRVVKAIKERFDRQRREITTNQLRQAQLPMGADCLTNSVGTAPGFSMKWGKCRLICLPGVSHEARQMFTETVQPLLSREGYVRPPLRMRTIHTFGLLEGHVDEAIADLVPKSGRFRLGLLASPMGVSVSLTEIHPEHEKNKENRLFFDNNKVELEVLVKSISTRLYPHVYGYDHEKMEEVVGNRLRDSGLSISVAESCTGGLIGHRITQVAGSSGYFERGVVCYSNHAKTSLLGVSPAILRRYGAVSAQVARRMAEGVREGSGTALGLSVTGIAGPLGGTAAKPVGLVYVGLSTPNKTFIREFRFHGDRGIVKLRSSQGALDVVRRHVCGLPMGDA